MSELYAVEVNVKQVAMALARTLIAIFSRL